jgi:hypothetical protein
MQTLCVDGRLLEGNTLAWSGRWAGGRGEGIGTHTNARAWLPVEQVITPLAKSSARRHNSCSAEQAGGVGLPTAPVAGCGWEGEGGMACKHGASQMRAVPQSCRAAASGLASPC